MMLKPGGLIVTATGHRPPKLGGFGHEARFRLETFARSVLTHQSADYVITGGALGWDQAVAVAAIYLQIPFAVYVPCEGQERPWPDEARARYHSILQSADRVEVVSPGAYSARKMEFRNIRMVDDGGVVAALWNGSSGGTSNCLDYAKFRKKPIENYWDRWQSFLKTMDQRS